MDRRGFFKRAGAIGITAAVSEQASQDVAPSFCSAAAIADAPNEDRVKCLPDESGVMKGAPPPEDKQVTRENREQSQAKMRWAMQHWRELYPTQRVGRSATPLILPRTSRDVGSLVLSDTMGQKTTVERQLERPSEQQQNGSRSACPALAVRRRGCYHGRGYYAHANSGGDSMPIINIQARALPLDRKRELVAQITELVGRAYQLPPETITVLIQELPAENIGVAGRLLSDRES